MVIYEVGLYDKNNIGRVMIISQVLTLPHIMMKREMLKYQQVGRKIHRRSWRMIRMFYRDKRTRRKGT